jgi:glycerol-3-phosphate O-acyltransferase
MLGYYRNPINFVFFNESIIVCAIFSLGADQAWNSSHSYEQVFERACYLAELIKREEVLKEMITPKTRAYFDRVMNFMQEQRLLSINPDT